MMNRTKSTSIPTCAALIALVTASSFSQTIPAFPGAEGYAADITGGRGGRIIFVDNLNDDGPGSFRAACEAEGRRIVVFRVSGYINLKKWLLVTNGDLTIAGQTAPGDGICLRLDPSLTEDTRLVTINASNVIVRYLRFRRGFVPPASKNSNEANLTVWGPDGHHVLLDHLSLCWSEDDNGQTWNEGHHTTSQYILYGPNFEHHNTGLPLNGDYIDIHHSAFLNTSHRHPNTQKCRRGKFINNIVYNWRARSFIFGGDYGTCEADVIGYLWKKGPQDKGKPEITISDTDDNVSNNDASLFVAGCKSPKNSDPDDYDAQWNNCFVWNVPRKTYDTPCPTSFRRDTPLPDPTYPVTIDHVEGLESKVLDEVGCSHRLDENGNWVFIRDSADEEFIQDYSNGNTGDYPVDNSDITWPELDAGTPYTDSDEDGMADTWEKNTFGNLTTARYDTARKTDYDGDGYYDLEEFLNGTAAVTSTEPPKVKFTQPTETVLTEPADLGVVAEATAPGGSIDNVKLYLNDTFVRQENNTPYEWGTAGATANDSALLGLTEGTYTLRVTATDTNGTTASDTMEITVEPAAVGVRKDALPLPPVSTDHAPQVFDTRGRRVLRVAVPGNRREVSHATDFPARGVYVVKLKGNAVLSKHIAVIYLQK